MKNVKIYNESLMPIGIVDIENLPQDTYGKFVKVFDDKFLPAGVIALGDLPHDTSGKYVKTIGNDFLPTGIVETGGGTPSPTPGNRTAYRRQGSQDYDVAVNEQGQLITTSTNRESALVCYTSNDEWNIGGGANNFFTESQWNDMLTNWGTEIITEMSQSSSDRYFILPAKNGMSAQRYTVDMVNMTIDPNIEEYSA